MNVRRRRNPPAVKAAAVLLGLVLSGCGGSGTGGGDGSSGGGFFNNMFGGASPTAQPVAAETRQAMAPAGSEPVELQHCPPVEVRSGNESIQVHAGEQTPANLRYQVSIANLARECWRNGAAGSVKLGVAGRVILGPKGTSGSYVVPVRVTVLRGGTDQVYTNVVRLPVSVGAGQSSAAFAHVAENVSFPLEGAGDRLTRYLINVGFDTPGQGRR